MNQFFFIIISNQVSEPDFLSYVSSCLNLKGRIRSEKYTILIIQSDYAYSDLYDRILSYAILPPSSIRLVSLLSNLNDTAFAETDEFVINLLGGASFNEVIEPVASILTGCGCACYNIRVHEPIGEFIAVDLFVRGRIGDLEMIRNLFRDVSSQSRCDICCQPKQLFDCLPKLVCFDMDSTLIQAEMIDKLAEYKQLGRSVASITEAAMRGEIDFQESFRKRTHLLAGLHVDVLHELAEKVLLTESLGFTVAGLKKAGCKLAILSGGYSFFCDYFKNKLGFDYAFGSRPEIENNQLTGNLAGPIMDAQGKARALTRIAQLENIELSRTVCVGDGANDLLMLQKAGRGVAYHGKPKLIQSADFAISYTPMCSLLYILGLM